MIRIELQNQDHRNEVRYNWTFLSNEYEYKQSQMSSLENATIEELQEARRAEMNCPRDEYGVPDAGRMTDMQIREYGTDALIKCLKEHNRESIYEQKVRLNNESLRHARADAERKSADAVAEWRSTNAECIFKDQQHKLWLQNHKSEAERELDKANSPPKASPTDYETNKKQPKHTCQTSTNNSKDEGGPLIAQRQLEMPTMATINPNRKLIECRFFDGMPNSCRFDWNCQYSHDDQLFLKRCDDAVLRLNKNNGAQILPRRTPTQPNSKTYNAQPHTFQTRTNSPNAKPPRIYHHVSYPIRGNNESKLEKCRYFNGVPSSCRSGRNCKFSHDGNTELFMIRNTNIEYEQSEYTTDNEQDDNTSLIFLAPQNTNSTHKNNTNRPLLPDISKQKDCNFYHETTHPLSYLNIEISEKKAGLKKEKQRDQQYYCSPEFDCGSNPWSGDSEMETISKLQTPQRRKETPQEYRERHAKKQLDGTAARKKKDYEEKKKNCKERSW